MWCSSFAIAFGPCHSREAGEAECARIAAQFEEDATDQVWDVWDMEPWDEMMNQPRGHCSAAGKFAGIAPTAGGWWTFSTMKQRNPTLRERCSMLASPCHNLEIWFDYGVQNKSWIIYIYIYMCVYRCIIDYKQMMRHLKKHEWT